MIHIDKDGALNTPSKPFERWEPVEELPEIWVSTGWEDIGLEVTGGELRLLYGAAGDDGHPVDLPDNIRLCRKVT